MKYVLIISMNSIQNKHLQLAYFSMEIMLRTHIPTYAGGLGILAGDLLRSCADMHIPAAGMTLVYNGTFFNQVFNPDGSQSYKELEWRKSDQFTKMPHRVQLTLDDQVISVGCWRYDIVGYDGFVVPVYLLDTDYVTNPQWARNITSNLYAGNGDMRVSQELVLGIGGVLMLKKLRYETIDTYHMNEGHAAFVPLALMPEHNWNDEEVKRKCVFTTHTPIPEGHDTFDYELAYKYGKAYFPWHIKKLAGEDRLDMTRLALNTSKYSFGVSQKHGEVSRNMFPGYPIGAITNGVHHRTWIGSTMQDLYNEHMPEWINNPSTLSQAVEKLPDDALFNMHQECKKILVNFVNHHLTSNTTLEGREHPDQDELFDIDTLTIALARRPVAYKRPLLIYHDLERLVRIAAGRVQIIQSGKSHPDDGVSHQIVKEILHMSKKLKGIVRIVYLENYSPKLARLLVSGTDVWLNSPKKPLEASGTSGMKAAMNGVLNFSVLDGWWIEGFKSCPDAGFSIGMMDSANNDESDADDLYTKLEHTLIPTYYDNRKEWIRRMKNAITLGAYFNTNRCIEEYKKKAWDS
jgi:starch phosphorylase